LPAESTHPYQQQSDAIPEVVTSLKDTEADEAALSECNEVVSSDTLAQNCQSQISEIPLKVST